MYPEFQIRTNMKMEDLGFNTKSTITVYHNGLDLLKKTFVRNTFSHSYVLKFNSIFYNT